MSDPDSFFVDTNVLLYGVAGLEPDKRDIANAWLSVIWDRRQGRLSWQVVNEFYSNAVKKFRIEPEEARSVTVHLLEWMPLAPTAPFLRRAWHWCDSAQLNYWDALIVAAAEQSGCQWLLSEDFQSGREFGAITVVNPFLRQPSEFGLV